MKTNNSLLKIGFILAIIILVGVGLYLLISNTAFSFATMLIVALLAILLLFQFHRSHPARIENDERRRNFSIMIVGCYGLLAMFAMSNYFYPSKEIFSNNDHHAIALEGLETSRSSLLLAANSNNAFFDDHTLAGSIELRDILTNDSTATLRLNGVGIPVYKIEYDKEEKDNFYIALEGQDNIHSWSPEDQLELLNEHSETAVAINVDYYKEWQMKRLHSIWKSRFILEYVDNDGVLQTDTSSYDGIIRHRYSLASLFPGIETIHGIDLSKIELLRPKARMTFSRDDNEKLASAPLLVCYHNESGLGAIRSGDTRTNIGTSSSIGINLDGHSLAIGLNNSIPDFRITVDMAGHTAIRYRMPYYRYLSTESFRQEKNAGQNKNSYYTFMVASTLINEDGEVNNQIPQNILLYNLFDHVNNIYQMRPVFVSFQRGNTTEPLHLNILDSQNGHETQTKAGQQLPPIVTSDPATHWIASLDNFRDPSLVRPKNIKSPLSGKTILGFMLILTILCCCTLMVKEMHYHTYIEPIAYIVLLSLLAIRLTLLWRSSVFPPTSSITFNEFNAWRSSGGVVNHVMFASLLLVLLIFLNKTLGFSPIRIPEIKNKWLKWINNINPSYFLGEKGFVGQRLLNNSSAYYPAFGRAKEKQNLHTLLWPKGRKSLWVVGGLAFYIVILVIGLATRKPLVCVGLPVILYFVVDFFINIQVGSCWTDHGNDSYAFFWQGLINMLLASAVMFVLDGGYGLIFFVFCMISMILRLIDLYGGNGYNKKKGTGIREVGVFIIGFLFIFGIARLRSIVVSMFTGGMMAFVIAALIAALLVALLIWTVGGWQRFPKWSIFFVMLSAGLTLGGGFLFNHFKSDGSRIINRVMVLANEPSKILGQATTPPDMNRFLEASLNDWVLEEYEQRGKDVTSVIGEHGRGYFKLQPHSKVGVSWMTQLTDLSVSRFIIAEQSTLVPILLIVLFFAMVMVALFFPSDRRWAKSLLIQIPLLLAIQSLLVWMAVTRRFVFVGQDFPMISLISKVNLYMCIIGFFVWVLTAIIENWYLYAELEEPNIDKKEIRRLIEGSSSEERRKNKTNIEMDAEEGKMYRFLNNFSIISTVAILAAVFVIICLQPKRHFKENLYDVKDCVDATYMLICKPDANSIEALFREYQENLIEETNQDRSRGRIYDISRIGAPHDILEGFCRAYGYAPGNSNNDNPIDWIFAQDKLYGPFAKASFDDFVKRKAGRNDINELIYIVKRRYIDPDNNQVENVRYAFDVTSRYFRQQLPRRIDKSWRGSITGTTALADNVFDKQTVGNVDVYTLPSSWIKGTHPALIVKPNSNTLSVVGLYEPHPLRRGEGYYLSEGEVLTGRNAPNLAKYGCGNYMARNVFINSQPQFIYPMQTDLYWARPFAEQVGAYMNYSMSKAENKSEFEELMSKNTEVTLSIEMTRNLVHAIDGVTRNGNVAVVVADGDGKVRALVEHRNPHYLINPNDARRIQFVEDSLKREGMLNRGREAERYFCNKALLSLNYGPGSSQKPIVWSAVTSQYTGWDWNQLQMARINNNLMRRGGNKYHAWSFAGVRIDPRRRPIPDRVRSMFRSIQGDEGGGSTNVDVQGYMRKSSNYYNAIMVYIGSHTREELEAGNPDSNPLFKSQNQSWLTRNDGVEKYCDTLFPLISYRGSLYSFAQPLQASNIQEPRAILLQGLEQNFGLPTTYVNNNSSNLHKSLQDSKKVVGNYCAFPEISYFNNQGRLGDRSLPYEVTREGIKSTAIGQKTVWIVSPLKMAEMYGRLISFNSNYQLTIDPNANKLPYKEFNIDGNANDYLVMRNQQFIPGIKEVYTASTGTAHSVYNSINNNLGDYFIYGKTGTIDGKLKHRSEEDHLLAVIITNKDLETLNNVSDYSDLRFYVIYIADFDYEHDRFSWKTTDAAIINTVLQSEEFKHYMKGE